MYFFSKERDWDGVLEDCLFVFIGGEVPSLAYFKEKVQSSFSERLRPERVIVVYPYFFREKIKEVVEGGGRDDLERYGDKVAVDYVFFDVSGRVYKDADLKSGDESRLSDTDVSFLVEAGMEGLVNKNKDNIFMSSPPGTVFIKPSGRTFGQFIKASELICGFDEAVFIAFCVLVIEKDIKSVEKVYIDTNGLMALVMALNYLVTQFFGKPWNCLFENFRSYGGVDAVSPVKAINSMVLISATTSNSLSEKIIAAWGLPQERVITVLGVPNRDGASKNLLLNIENFIEPQVYASDDSAMKVKVAADNFAVEVGRPRKVTIKRIFSISSFSKFTEKHAFDSFFSVNRSVSGSPAPKSLHYDVSAISDESELDDWIDKIVRWYLPLGDCVLVYEGKEKDKVFLKIEKAIKNKKIVDQVEVVSSVSLGRARGVANNHTVIYYTPVVASGKRVLSANRDLRIAGHKGNRVYVSVLHAYPGDKERADFENSVSYAGPGFKYSFVCYKSFNSGRGVVRNPWREELSFISNFKSDFWVGRKRILGRHSVGIYDEIGLRSDGSHARPEFTVGFAFWSDKYNPDNVKGAAVFALFSSMLSGLRGRKADDQGSLKSQAYQHAVIDPQNFWRFTDPLIQSCLWRAAQPSELDYRGCESMSADIEDLILKYANDALSNKQSSAIDLLLAIGMGWIKVSRSSLKRITDSLPKKLKNIDYVAELVLAIQKLLERDG